MTQEEKIDAMKDWAKKIASNPGFPVQINASMKTNDCAKTAEMALARLETYKPGSQMFKVNYLLLYDLKQAISKLQ
jgi:oligoribonuclease (3'-5' exoribonuclease)